MKLEYKLEIPARMSVLGPSIKFVKNPQYSPQSTNFKDRVIKLLQMNGYKLHQVSLQEDFPIGYVVFQVKVGFISQKCGVIIFYDAQQELEEEYLQSIYKFLQKQLDEGNIQNAILITTKNLSTKTKTSIPFRSGMPILTPLTHKDLLQKLIDFDQYIHFLKDQYRDSSGIKERVFQPPLSEVYIPLKAEATKYGGWMEPENSSPNRNSNSRSLSNILGVGDLDKKVQLWLEASNISRLVLLADYGSGKTTYSYHLSAKLAEEYIAASEHDRDKHRIPLLIPLRDFARNAVKLEGFLISYLKQYCKVENPDFDALLKMAEEGYLLFILDGFDEMAARADADTVRQNIAEFEILANLPKNKVLLTTRPEYFLNISEEQEILDRYKQLNILPFDKQQIENYLKKRLPPVEESDDASKPSWKYFQKRIEKTYDLADVTTRPVLLEMTITALSNMLSEEQIFNRPNLYYIYLSNELKRQIDKNRDLKIKLEKRLEILERLAFEFYTTDAVSITSDQIFKLLENLLGTEQRSQFEGLMREILACSFLTRIGDEFRFSHQSFLEYFVARHLAKAIDRDAVAEFMYKEFSRAIREFLAEMEGKSSQNTDKGRNAGHSIYFQRTTLEAWITQYPRNKIVIANALAILGSLKSHYVFSKLKIAYQLDLSNVNLSGINLSGIDLSHADLTGADLSQTDLTGARLYQARLTNANLWHSVLNEVNLIEANLWKANLRQSYIKKADLAQAILEKADLSAADLSEANLEGVNFTGSNLTDAKLVGANLDKAKWGEVAKANYLVSNSKKSLQCKNLNLALVKNLDSKALQALEQGGALITQASKSYRYTHKKID